MPRDDDERRKLFSDDEIERMREYLKETSPLLAELLDAKPVEGEQQEAPDESDPLILNHPVNADHYAETAPKDTQDVRDEPDPLI